MVGQIAAGRFAAAVERFEDQRFDFAVGEAGGGERVGLDRHPAFVLGTRVLCDALAGGGSVAAASAVTFGPAVRRRRRRGRQLVDAVQQRVEPAVVVVVATARATRRCRCDFDSSTVECSVMVVDRSEWRSGIIGKFRH